MVNSCFSIVEIRKEICYLTTQTNTVITLQNYIQIQTIHYMVVMVAVSAVCNLDYPLFPIEHLKLSGIPEVTVGCWVSFVELSVLQS